MTHHPCSPIRQIPPLIAVRGGYGHGGHPHSERLYPGQSADTTASGVSAPSADAPFVLPPLPCSGRTDSAELCGFERASGVRDGAARSGRGQGGEGQHCAPGPTRQGPLLLPPSASARADGRQSGEGRTRVWGAAEGAGRARRALCWGCRDTRSAVLQARPTECTYWGTRCCQWW